MKKIKNFVFSIWPLVSFVVLGPVLVCGYSLSVALINGYSVERPLYALLAIAVVAFTLYYPMTKAHDMHMFDISHDFESGSRLFYGGVGMCLIASFPELAQMREFCYTNHLMLWLFNGWFLLVIGSFALLILILVFGIDKKST